MKNQGEDKLMMMVGFLLVTVLMTMLTGCATKEKFEARLQSTFMFNEQKLIMAIGTPTSVYVTDDDNKILTYSTRGGSTSTITHNQGYSTVSHNSGAYCTVNFFLKGGYVTDWRWEGNGCIPAYGY